MASLDVGRDLHLHHLVGIDDRFAALDLSTTSMPDTTPPITVYFPFSDVPSANMMKNGELAETTLAARAMPTMPRLNGTLENWPTGSDVSNGRCR